MDAVTNPQGLVTQEAIQAIAKENPEAAGALGEVLTVKSQLQELGVQDAVINLDKEAGVTSISEIKTQGEKEAHIGNLIGKDIKKEDFRVRNAKFSKEGGITTIQTDSGGEITLKTKKGNFIKYAGMKEGSIFKFNGEGELTEANILVDKRVYRLQLGDKSLDVLPDYNSQPRVTYKEGVIDITGKYNDFFRLKTSDPETGKRAGTEIKFVENGANVRVEGNHYSGKHFSVAAEHYSGESFTVKTEQLSGEYFTVTTEQIPKNILTILDGGVVLGKETLLDTQTKIRIRGGTPLTILEGGTLSFKPYEFEPYPGVKLKEYEVVIEAKNVHIPKLNERFNGKVGFFQEDWKVKLYDNTEFSILNPKDDSLLTTIKTDKPIDYYTIKGKCSAGQNCIQHTAEELFTNLRDGARITVEDPGSKIRNIASRKINDDSSLEVTQEGTTLTFTKDPLKIRGDLLKTNIENVDQEYTKEGRTRILQITVQEITKRQEITREKVAVFTQCPPCTALGGASDPDLKVRYNALKDNNALIKSYSDGTEKSVGVKPRNLAPYFDDSRERDLTHSFGTAFKKYPQLNPNLVLAAAANEGLMATWVERNYYNDPTAPVNGFLSLGLDRFGERAEDFKKQGCGHALKDPCLAASFTSYSPMKARNEKREDVISATFPSLEAGLEAFGAQLWRTQSKFLNDAKKLGINTRGLNQRHLDYWTYVYYNSGEEEGLKFLRGAKARNELIPTNRIVPAKKVIKVAGGGTRETTNAEYNALRVVLTSELLDKSL